MSASTSKLEMSLDDIIKAQKGKGNVQSAAGKKPSGVGAKIRRGAPINKRRQVLVQRGRRQIGGINKNRINQGKRLISISIPKKRIGGIRVLRKQPIRGGPANRFIRKNVAAVGNNNRAAVVSATKNLVKKLVKKAIAKNVVSSMAAATAGAGRGGKLIRIPANRLRQRSILLNRISNRSRAIGRRPQRIAIQQNRSPVILQQPANVRGRGPIRFATGPLMQTATPRIITLPKRRRNTIQYVQQQQAPVAFQPRIINPAGGRGGQPQLLSVRGQINAMRRATRVQQLNTQFLKQQSRPQPIINVVRAQPAAARRQQVITVQQLQQQRSPRRRRQQQQPIIILQQQAPPPRGRQQQQFFGGRPAGRRGGGGPQFQQQQQRGPRGGQQVIQLDPMYVPPNYLQRI